jgi:structural maintenance of chromosome 2
MQRFAWRLETNFRDPENNFDRSKVKGKVIRLFTIESDRYSVALEQVAGAKLFNVVVDNENTSQLLLSRKCFDNNVYLIPNNKIQGKTVDNNVMRLVQEIAGNEARLAIDLIKFEQIYTPTMQFIFGNVFVCNSSDIAKKLAFHPNIKTKCVNLEGDVFDPSGSLTGGSNIRQESILNKVQEYNYFQEKIKGIKSRIHDLNNNMRVLSEKSKLIILI